MKRTGDATVAGDGIYAGLEKKTVTKRKHCIVIEFNSQKDLADAFRKGIARFTVMGEDVCAK